ncbi:unnamed protein product, partial [Sphacelaria rigidula]
AAAEAEAEAAEESEEPQESEPKPDPIPTSKYGHSNIRRFLAHITPAEMCPEWVGALLSVNRAATRNGPEVKKAIQDAIERCKDKD